MINSINLGITNPNISNVRKNSNITAPSSTKAVTTPIRSANYTNAALVNAYQGYNGISLARTVSFGQGSLQEALSELEQKMFTCRDIDAGVKGEEVGKHIPVSKIVDSFADKLPKLEDAIKTNVEISKSDNKFVEARTQVKKTKDGILYEMAVRPERLIGTDAIKTQPLTQLIDIHSQKGTPEETYVLNTKGKLMAVVHDGKNVLLTNTGFIEKKNNEDGNLLISVTSNDNTFRPFRTTTQSVKERTHQSSIGKGTEIVIGMEKGRFVPEIIDSIQTFVDKVENGEIVLDQFIAAPNADKTQLSMLAGGFGSRAEYTNASSDRIFHNDPNGAQSTKGVFRTATGLTPMETTFITLHNAGLLDCSKGNLGIGKNIKLYLNESGINKGNGGFTVDLYNKMAREGRDSLTIFPNDSMSRMTTATVEMTNLMNSGNVALAMIAKKVSADDAKGNFGIMKLGENNEILEFAEKPKVIPDGYADDDNMCLTNTFQFSVSKEAFKALSIIEPYFPAGKGKEPRDWSKTYVPILMALTQKDNIKEITDAISAVVDAEDGQIPQEAIIEAKNILGNQKIVAVPTAEPWADCGTLNQLYHTTMQIANNDFALEDFERKHVLDCTNTISGLVASSPEQKAEIEDKYYINGQVMVVPKVEKVDESIVQEYMEQGLITVNPKQIIVGSTTA